MFTHLYPIAQGATLHLLITAEGEKLRVFVQPKPTGKDAPVPGPLALLATPAELDAEVGGFAEAITTWRAPSTPLIEQAKAAAALPATPANPADEDGDDAATRPQAATGKPKRLTAQQKKAEAKKAADEARKAKADKAAADRKAKADAAAKAKADKATAAAQAREQKAKEKAAAKAKPVEGAGAEPADRDACIADMRAYLAGNAASETPVKPSRSDYLNQYKPATGRRYERLFTSFDEFVAAARQQGLPLEMPAPVNPAVLEGFTVDIWPEQKLPEAGRIYDGVPILHEIPDNAVTRANTSGHSWDVYAQDGTYRSSMTSRPYLGCPPEVMHCGPGATIIAIDGERGQVIYANVPPIAPNAEAQQPGETNQDPGSDVTAVTPDTAAVASAPTAASTAPTAVALRDLQAPPRAATDALFTGEPDLEEPHTPTAETPALELDALANGGSALDDDDAPLNLI